MTNKSVGEHYPHQLYDKIKVDMDYSADPVWCSSKDDNIWANDSLTEYKPFLSEELYYSLTVYQRVWEDLSRNIDIEFTLNSLLQLDKSLTMMQLDLAVELKKELPLKRIFFCHKDDQSERYVEREVLLSPKGEITIANCEE